MRRFLIAAGVAALLVPSTGIGRVVDQQQQTSCVSLHQYHIAVRHALRYSAPGGDFHAGTPTRASLARIGSMRNCAKAAKPYLYRSEVHYWRAVAKTWRFYAYVDRITVYGKWAIPPSIVECESHGSWGAANPSGAVGPYQLLGWGAPYPATTPKAQAANHIIAARVWAGGRGRSNWVC